MAPFDPALIPRSLGRRVVAGAPAEIRRALLADDGEREAATQATGQLMARADALDPDGAPLVHGWAVHAAFLAGVLWQKLRQESARPPSKNGERD